ncbi:MAG: trimethylamine methyltransferase family protein [Actinomycetota bacterium]
MFTPDDAPKVLTEEQLDTIHEQALTILEDVGMDILWDPALELLGAEGNKVEGTRVRFDRAWLMEMVAKAPTTFSVRPRNPENEIMVGDGSLVLLPVGGSPFVSDLDRGRRSGTIADHDELIKLAHATDIITCLQSATVEAQDLPVMTRHMDMDYSILRNSDKAYVAYGGTGYKVRDSIEMAAIACGGRAAIEEIPGTMVVINPISPLVWDERMSDALIATAEANQGLIVTPFLLAGATAPVSISGSLSIQVAEALSGTAIAQAVRPGTPCMYGSFFTPLDMRTGAPAFGLPQGVLGTLAGAQLSRRYGLPYRGGGALASGNAVDGQAASESANSLWATFLAASDFVLHAAGWLEGGLTASFEKFALDVEMCREFLKTKEGIGFTDEELALDEIEHMGPAGMYLESAHTMGHFREWLYMSPLFTTPDFNTWQAMGEEGLDRRANAMWKQILESYEDPGIDDAVDEELREFIAKRKEETVDDDE